VPLAGALQVFSTQVLSAGSAGFGIGSGVPKLHPVLVQSGAAVFTAGAVEVGPIVQLEVGQWTANRLIEPSGVGPSGTPARPPPRSRPPQVRFLMMTALPSCVLPQTPPGALLVNSRNAPPTDAVVEVVEDVVVLVVELVVIEVEVVVVVGLVVLVVELVVVEVEVVVVVGLVVVVVGLVVLVVELVEVEVEVVLVVGLVVLVVGLVVLVVEVVVLVVELVEVEVEVVVVATGHGGSPGSPVQVHIPALHWLITFLEHWLAAMPEKAPHAELISSEQFFLPHAGGAALAPETKTPAVSATAANVTTAFLVIVEPPYGRSHPVAVADPKVRFGALVKMKKSRRAAGGAAATMPRRATPPRVPHRTRGLLLTRLNRAALV
jgi:hypothetical protein